MRISGDVRHAGLYLPHYRCRQDLYADTVLLPSPHSLSGPRPLVCVPVVESVRPMIYEAVKKALKKPLHFVGMDLVRRHPHDERSDDLPPLYDDPLEALWWSQKRGKEVAFRCPLDLNIMGNGFSCNPHGWHPFVEALREYAAGSATSYEGSILETFYQTHQPANAAEAIAGFDRCPPVFESQPAHVYRLFPWRPKTVGEIESQVRQWTNQENRIHGDEDVTLDLDGYPYHGPVSPKKGRLEYRRLLQIYDRLASQGYDRSYGHARVVPLRRGTEYRFFVSGGGLHRTAAMASLNYDTIPAVFEEPVVELEMIEYWPQVRHGVWSRAAAEAYFNHLFDFDSRAWARDRGLLFEENEELHP